jgi:N-ethylmaleimide reductase
MMLATMAPTVFDSYTLGTTTLRNRSVMAPMTRSRATGNLPNELMATYYRQRASAGLIVTEGTSPSPNGLGYARIPGIFSEDQATGWRSVTDAVHDEGGAIFVQLMHAGRVGHPLNIPGGAAPLAPSAVPLEGKMFTDQEGMLPYPLARAMTTEEVEKTVGEYALAAKLADQAGFDGVELHGANGYLIEQFLSPHTNLRDDSWGGSVAKRRRFAIETARAAVKVLGEGRVGMRLSPYGAFNGMVPYPEIDESYVALVKDLAEVGVAYVHLVDHSSMGAPPVSEELVREIRETFPRTIILSGGYDLARANAMLAERRADLIAFGRPWLANPDLLDRLRVGTALNPHDFSTFYTPGEKGYTDYPQA